MPLSSRAAHRNQEPSRHRALRCLVLIAISGLALATLGYHPFAEDGGVYYTPLLQRLHPELFPYAHDLALAHLSRSAYLAIFSGALAHLPISVDWALALLHCLSTASIIAATYSVARALQPQKDHALLASAIVGVSLSLPLAGTALYLADPYVTARSLSTPLLLAALALLLRNRIAAAAIIAAITMVIHPLMGLWGSASLVAVWCARTARPTRALSIYIASLTAACCLVAALSPPEDGVALTLAASRSYWYLSQWQWFEWIGILAPPAMLWWISLRTQPQRKHALLQRQLALATVIVFASASIISLALVHPGSQHLLLARMQPLRMLQMAYLSFLLLLGLRIASWCASSQTRRSLVAATLLVVSGILFFVQRSIYPASAHVEVPGAPLHSPWAQAFTWIRNNTAVDSVIAMDPQYTSSPGADAQNARAITERSTLPDYSKDGGVASVYTQLGPAWQAALAAQTGIDTMSDSTRLQRLAPLHVNWIVLRSSAATALPCPYRNDVVKVCGLPR